MAQFFTNVNSAVLQLLNGEKKLELNILLKNKLQHPYSKEWTSNTEIAKYK